MALPEPAFCSCLDTPTPPSGFTTPFLATSLLLRFSRSSPIHACRRRARIRSRSSVARIGRRALVLAKRIHEYADTGAGPDVAEIRSGAVHGRHDPGCVGTERRPPAVSLCDQCCCVGAPTPERSWGVCVEVKATSVTRSAPCSRRPVATTIPRGGPRYRRLYNRCTTISIPVMRWRMPLPRF